MRVICNLLHTAILMGGCSNFESASPWEVCYHRQSSGTLAHSYLVQMIGEGVPAQKPDEFLPPKPVEEPKK